MDFHFAEGELLLINKPFRWTSFDVVNKIKCSLKHHLGIKNIKIGHAGTLDPLATGLLLICTGKFTKKINDFQQFDKEYTGIFEIGATTPSADLEKEIIQRFDYSTITHEEIYAAAKKFVGLSMQHPPLFSAKKIEGERAYEKARRGENVIVEAKPIIIDAFDITKIEMPEVHFRVSCSKGTYIRALARDFGIALNNGAYLKSLCRTRIGNYHLKDAMEIDALMEQIKITQK